MERSSEASSSSLPPSLPFEDEFPVLFGNKKSIASLVQKLLEFKFYQFKSPEVLADSNQFIFRLNTSDKSFLNPGFGSSKLYQEYKSRVLTQKPPTQLQISLNATEALVAVEPEKTEPINLDALLAYCFHRSTAAKLSPEDTSTFLRFGETFPEIDILEFFGIPQIQSDEKIPLSLSNLHPILEEKFFVFRLPEGSYNKIFLRMNSGLFIHLITYCKKQEIETDFLFSGKNVVTYKGQFYSKISLDLFTDIFTIPFCMDLGTRWEVNNDNYI
jgi:hypothetical protein